MNIKKAIKHWKVGTIDKQLWSDHAQHGTVMIELDEGSARAVIVDDHEGVRAVFKLAPEQIGEVITAATQAWHERKSPGSLAVFSKLATRIRGGLTPPPPPPPPGPGGHERIFMMQTVAAHTTFDVAAELVELAERGELDERGELRLNALRDLHRLNR